MTSPRDMDIEIGVISDDPEHVLTLLNNARMENIRRIESLERENDDLLDLIELVSDLIAKRAERQPRPEEEPSPPPPPPSPPHRSTVPEDLPF